MEIVQERIRLCNEINKNGLFHMSVHNLNDADGMPSGMRVEVRIPFVIE